VGGGRGRKWTQWDGHGHKHTYKTITRPCQRKCDCAEEKFTPNVSDNFVTCSP